MFFFFSMILNLINPTIRDCILKCFIFQYDGEFIDHKRDTFYSNYEILSNLFPVSTTMEDHHIKVDLLKLLDDNRLTVTQGTSDKKNSLFVVGKSSGLEKLEEFASCYADRINLKIVTVENLSLGKETNSNCWFDYLFIYLFVYFSSVRRIIVPCHFVRLRWRWQQLVWFELNTILYLFAGWWRHADSKNHSWLWGHVGKTYEVMRFS